MDMKLHKVKIKSDNHSGHTSPRGGADIEEYNDIESVLNKLKLSGRYHIKLYTLIFICNILTAPHATNYVFAAPAVNYRCKYENCEINEANIKSKSIIDYRCHKYELLDENGTCTEDNFNVTTAATCNEWVYDDPNSFVAEFDLGCEDWKRTLVGTMHSIGQMLGVLLTSPLSDKIGRKKLIILNIMGRGSFGVCKSFITSYWLYITFEMFETIIGDSYTPLFTMAVEMITKHDRPILIMLLSITTTLGQIWMALLAYLTPSWRLFLLSIYGPLFTFILYIFCLDESLRWLLTKGKKIEAEKIIKEAAKMNKIEFNDSILANLRCENTARASVLTLIKETLSSKKLFKRFLICVLIWFTSLFNAYVLLINSVSLEGNKYINYGLVATCGAVAAFILLFVLTKFKRKGPLIFSFALTGAFCIAQALLPKGYRWLSTILYLCGKVSATMSVKMTYLYTSELFPTYTRSTMMGLCSSTGRTAVLLAPQTPLLMKYWTGLPILIMGILSLITATVVTFMPDTSEDVLPDNVKQAEALGMKHKEKEVSHF